MTQVTNGRITLGFVLGWLLVIPIFFDLTSPPATGQEPATTPPSGARTAPKPPASSGASAPSAGNVPRTKPRPAASRATSDAPVSPESAPAPSAGVEPITEGPPDLIAPHMGAPFAMMSPGIDPQMIYGEVTDPWRIWARADYLMWWVEGMDTPPLVTSSPGGTDRDVAGVLGQPTTAILYGGEGLVDTMRPGGRFTGGYWFDWARFHGVEISLMGLLSRDSNFAAQSSGNPVLARPFTNVEPGFEGADAELVAFPALLTGRIEAEAESRFAGAEVLYRGAWWQVSRHNFDLLAGWRYLYLDESLQIRDFKTSISTDSLVPVGTTIDELDSFSATNHFNGAEIGLLGHMRRNNWQLEVLGKLAFGNTRSEVDIRGSTTVTVQGEPDNTIPVGLLAQETNIGSYQRDVFSVVPEFGITAGYYLTPNVQARVGYTFIYWDRVARPGDQIDTSLNLSQLEPDGLIGPARPAFNWVESGLWIQGISLGLEGRF